MSKNNEREVGDSGLSIGTSLGLEGLYSPTEEVNGENKPLPVPDVSAYETIYINIETIVRNYVTSFTRVEDVADVLFVDDLILELELLQDTFKLNESTKDKEVLFFKQSEVDIDKRFLRKSKAKVVRYTNSVLESFINNFTLSSDYVYTERLYRIERGLIITHRVNDLVIADRRSCLLETHTGKVKTHDLWNTKYVKRAGKTNIDLSRLPFNLILLLVFGDRATYTAAPIKTRLIVEQLSRKYRWTPSTGVGLVKQQLSREDDPYLRDFIKPVIKYKYN